LLKYQKNRGEATPHSYKITRTKNMKKTIN